MCKRIFRTRAPWPQRPSQLGLAGKRPAEGREPEAMTGDMLTFEQARATLAAATGKPAADRGWENDDVFVVVNDYGADTPPLGEPDHLVDKRARELRDIYGLLGRDPVPNLRPITTQLPADDVCRDD